MDDDPRPSPATDAAEQLAREDLAPYSQDELARRIALLEAELSRVKEHIKQASASRAAADALFGAGKP